MQGQLISTWLGPKQIISDNKEFYLNHNQLASKAPYLSSE